MPTVIELHTVHGLSDRDAVEALHCDLRWKVGSGLTMIAREELQRLLAGSAHRETTLVSTLVETVTRLVVEQLRDAEQADRFTAEAARA